jgi:transposase-like protein
MALDACKRGFLEGCRPIIGIDGCHIKNRFGGVMLAAVGVDPNDCIFPIALAIVEVEDTKTWKWFLRTLKDDLGIENTRPWTFMSDRQKGLINAVNALWPDAQHRFYVRNLHQNFAKKGWRGDIFKNKLWQIARATRQEYWQRYMDEMKALDQGAFDYLDAIDPRQWCKAYFEELPKCDLLLNNICEVFNK